MKKTNHETFKKGDKVRVTAATLRLWWVFSTTHKYSGKVGEVTKTRSSPCPHPPTVDVRFKGMQNATLLSTMLEHA